MPNLFVVPNFVGQIQAAAPFILMALIVAVVLLIGENISPQRRRF